MNEPQEMWQGQRKEHPIMSLEEIRTKAGEAQSKVQRNLIVAYLLGSLVLVLGTLIIFRGGNIYMRLNEAAIVILTQVGIYTAYRRIWSRQMLSPESTNKGCVDFYRQELETQYRSLQLAWGYLITALVFAFLTVPISVRGYPRLPKILLSTVLLLILFERHREARKFNHKLSRLASFEGEK
jgi:hypothetical protein